MVATKQMSSAHIESFYQTLQSLNPHPETELAYTNTFTLLVAVVLSAQATDKGVNKATADLFKKVDTPEKMLALGLDALKAHVKTIGLYPTKAKNIIALSKILVEMHGGKVPNDRAGLEALPGVGRKTANVILNVAFGETTMAVDTHIFRVSNRTGLAPGLTPRQVEDALLDRTPKAYLAHAHHWLILLGRYTCVARIPKCGICPVRSDCMYPNKNP